MSKGFDFKEAAQCVSGWVENGEVHSDVVKMQTVGLLLCSCRSFYCPFMVVSHGTLFFFFPPLRGFALVFD